MPTPRLIPPQIPQRLLHHILVPCMKRQALVPRAIPTGHDLKALVLLGTRVIAAKPLEQLPQPDVARDVRGLELDLRPGGKLPRRRAGVEDMHLGVRRGEEVVVPGLAAHAARRVGHLSGGHAGVDVGPALWGAGGVVACAVGLGGIWVVGAGGSAGVDSLAARLLGPACIVVRVSHVVPVSIPKVLVTVTPVVPSRSGSWLDVGLALTEDGSSIGGVRGSATTLGVTTSRGVPTSRHDFDDTRNEAAEDKDELN